MTYTVHAVKGNSPLIILLAAHVSIIVVAGSTAALVLVATLIGIAAFVVFKRKTKVVDPGTLP